MLSCRDVSQTLQVGHQEWDRQHGARSEELALDAPIASQPQQSSVDRSRVCPIYVTMKLLVCMFVYVLYTMYYICIVW